MAALTKWTGRNWPTPFFLLKSLYQRKYQFFEQGFNSARTHNSQFRHKHQLIYQTSLSSFLVQKIWALWCKKLHCVGYYSGDGWYSCYSSVHYLSCCIIIAVPKKHDLGALTTWAVHPSSTRYSIFLLPHLTSLTRKDSCSSSFCKQWPSSLSMPILTPNRVVMCSIRKFFLYNMKHL